MIEANPVQTSDSQHLFLLSYRAVLMEAHASRKSAIDLQSSFLKGVEGGVYPKEEPSPLGMIAVEHMISAYLVEDVKKRFDQAYLIDSWDVISHQVFFIASRPALAVNSMFSTDLYSEVLDAPAFVTLNVFPVTHDQTAVVFSFIAEQKSEAVDAFGYIWSSGGDYQQYELSKLILRKAQNVVIAPDFSIRLQSTGGKSFRSTSLGIWPAIHLNWKTPPCFSSGRLTNSIVVLTAGLL